MENASLEAVASADRNKAQAFAAETGIGRACTHEELWCSDDIDAVYIATTHNFHYEQALACLQHGKAVLCEKPITVNDSQFSHLAEVAKSNHLFLMEGMWTWFLPAIQKAKEWVNEKSIGELALLQSDFGFVMDRNPQGRLYNPALAGGALLDLGIYPLAMAAYYIDAAPEQMHASGTLTSTGVDETVAILLQYKNCAASLCTSLISRLCNATRIYGEAGYIEIPLFWKAGSASLYDKEGNLLEAYVDGRSSHGFIYEMQHANDRILAGETESDVMPLARSAWLQKTMTEIRNQIGLKYPFE
jgi:predicted dehydrogenase